MSEIKNRMAKFLGLDLSTTVLAVGVRDAENGEDFVSIPMRGATKWRGQPAFDLTFLAGMICDALEELSVKGWSFSSPGALSLSVRQHDMVLLDMHDRLLIPALSWQCNAAEREVVELKKMGVEKTVGPIEERFILPKLLWVLGQDTTLKPQINWVMTTGDYIAFMLTGIPKLSTSDGVSNGLLVQTTKELATDVLKRAGLNPDWFPEVIQSGEVVDTISGEAVKEETILWVALRVALKGWQVVASLGDNHAGGVGCGLGDFQTIVVSAGSSGTINRLADPSSGLKGEAACFEYYEKRLLLMMLADCAVWYNRFVEKVEKFSQDKSLLGDLNQLAVLADFTKLVRVKQEKTEQGWQEIYPEGWSDFSLGEKVASTQASIVLELLLLVKKMFCEVVDSRVPKIARVVLTGGLSQSPFFQYAFQTGLKLIADDVALHISSHQGPLAFKSAALGALINAMVGSGYSTFDEAMNALCPTTPASTADLCVPDSQHLIPDFFKEHLGR